MLWILAISGYSLGFMQIYQANNLASTIVAVIIFCGYGAGFGGSVGCNKR